MLYSLCGSSSSVNASKLTSVPGTNQYSVISVKFLSQGNSGVPGWDSNFRLTGSDLMFTLLRTIKTLDLPYDIQIELFDKTIKPILLYASEIWSFGQNDVLEKIQLNFFKYVSNLKVILYSYFILKKMNERITDS